MSALLAVESNRLDPAIESLDVLHRVLTEIPGYMGSVAGGPYEKAELFDDGVTMAVASASSIDLWDLPSRRLIRSVTHESQAGRASIETFGQDGIAAVAASRQETIIYAAGAEEATNILTHRSLVNDISISADGGFLAAALDGGVVETWRGRRERCQSAGDGARG